MNVTFASLLNAEAIYSETRVRIPDGIRELVRSSLVVTVSGVALRVAHAEGHEAGVWWPG